MAEYKASVEGMMCQMCEKHMREAVEKAFGSVDCKADHVNNTVTFSTELDVTAEKMAEVVDEAGYEFKGML